MAPNNHPNTGNHHSLLAGVEAEVEAEAGVEA